MANFYIPPKPFIVFLLDGFGIGPTSAKNPISSIATPTLDSVWIKYPNSILEGEVYSSEKQLGQIYDKFIYGGLYPTLEERVVNSIQSKTFHKNPILVDSIVSCIQTNSNYHILAPLLTQLHIDVLKELLLSLKNQNFSGDQVFVHLIVQDNTSQDQSILIKKLDDITDKLGIGHISSLTGLSALKKSEDFLNQLMSVNDQEYDNWQDGYRQNFKRKQTLKTIIVNGIEDRFEPINDFDSVTILNFDYQEFDLLIINSILDERNIKVTLLTNNNTSSFEIMFPIETSRKSLFDSLSNSRLTKVYREDYRFVWKKSPHGNNIQHIVMSVDYISNLDLYFKDLFSILTNSIRSTNSDCIFVHIPTLLDGIEEENTDGLTQSLLRFDYYLNGLIGEVERIGGAILLTSTVGGGENMNNWNSTELLQSKLPFVLIDNRLVSTKLKKGSIENIAPTVLQILGETKPSTMNGYSLLS